MDKPDNNSLPQFKDQIIKVIKTNAPSEFRARIIKALKEDILKNDLTDATIILPEKYKSLLDNINGFIVIANYTTGMYEYISDGVKFNLGYNLSGFTKEKLTNFMFSIIHENHGKFILNHLLPTVFDYFKRYANAMNGRDYRYTVCSKLKDVYGVYKWYLIDTVIIEVDETGFPLKTLITCTNINQFKKDETVYYNIMRKNNDGVYEVMLEGTEDSNKRLEYKLTPREMQLLNLIGQGFTNKQIADKLSITLNTVQTHRKSIMKKTKCKGTADLTNFAFSRGLL
jgi:DNA-binding CsgD family transcriptional regulator